MRRWAGVAALALACLSLLLLVTNRRLLVWEGGAIQVNTEGVVQGGDLRCTYFTGRSFRTVMFAYSESGIMGVDQCPLLVRR